ncbi:MAG: PDZ domain-containing protein, partial [Planctomycetota bacterium]|nr:PDZ domain-containing protein [Planctomycetota bacterium]
ILRYIEKNSPAEKSGLKVGDVILKWNDEEVPQKDSVLWLRSKITAHNVGDVVEVTVGRAKEETKLKVALEKPPVVCEPRTYDDLVEDAALPLASLEEFIRNNNILEDYLEVRKMFWNVSERVFAPQEVKEGKMVYHPHLLSEVVYLMRNPEKTLLIMQKMADVVRTSFTSKNQDVAKILHLAADKLDAPLDKYQLINEDSFTLAQFTGVVRECAEKVNKVFENLSEEKRRALAETATKALLREESEGDAKEMLKVSLSLNYKELFSAALDLCRHLTAATLEAVKKNCASLVPLKEQVEGVEGEVLYSEKTPSGRIVIGGKGRNRYVGDDFLLILDLGGDDVYEKATAVSSAKLPVSLIIDYEGDDRYVADDSGGCGCGIFGIGILYDVSGNDTYLGKTLAEGAALFGVGALVDVAGEDTYKAESVCQGAALFGIGMLLDAQTQSPQKGRFAGSDRYLASHYAQGFGMPRGCGILIDTEGNDIYTTGSFITDFRAPERSAISLSQGFGYGWRPYTDPSFGAAGGYGLLFDLSGHDTYIADYFGQGSSYWFAFGGLYDESGDDVYVAGRYSQGAGIHLSLGILMDIGGNDRYSAYVGVSQGCGHDIACGILYDGSGDDIYNSGWLSQGAGNDNGIGILLECGGNDVYQTTAPQTAQPTGNLSKPRGDKPSFGLLLDIGGDDKYNAPGRTNETKLLVGKDEKEKNIRWGIFIDSK